MDDEKVDESFLQDFEILSILKGDFSPIDSFMDKIAYNNLDYKLNAHSKAHLIRKLLKV